VSNQHDFVEPSLLGKIDPGGDVSYLLTGHTPISAATDSFVTSPREDVSQVMHARVGCDGCVAALRQRPADRDIRWLVKIHAPSVNPDDGNGLGCILRWSKDCAGLHDVVVRANINNLLREFPGWHSFGARHTGLPDQENCPQQCD
jgi:hypothetical protein